jgi:hypothetical protein
VDPLPGRPPVRPRGATLSGLRRVRSDANAVLQLACNWECPGI